MSDLLSAKAQVLIEAAKEQVGALATPTNVAVPSKVYPAYSPAVMVDLMVDNPSFTHAQLALHFGRPPSWIAAVLASDSFQQALDTRRHEVADPSLTATMEERLKALAIRSMTVLQEKLNSPAASDLVVLKAAELGIKGLGMGRAAPETPQLPSPTNTSETVAERLLAALDQRDRMRTVDAEDVEVKGGK